MKKLFLLSTLILAFISISCDKEVSVTPPEPPLPKGKLAVTSYPEELLIFLNGKFTGSVTPDTLHFLAEGTYLLTLKKKYFRNINLSVKIDSDSLVSVYVDYRNYQGVLGTINIDSKPRGAEIFIDDSATGKLTPSILANVFPGDHSIRLKHENYWDYEFILAVESGKTIYPYLTLVDSSMWVNYNTENSGLPDQYINHTAIDQNNVKWIGTLSKGLVRFDDKNWTIFNSSNSPLPIDNIKYIAVDQENKKWICTQAGLLSFDGINWELFNSQNSGLPDDWVSCIAFDLNGDKWIGTTSGLVKFDGTNWTVYNETNSLLRSDFIECITIDRLGNKWIGTANQGMAKFDGINWTIYNSSRAGFPQNVAGGIAVDNNNTIWLGVSFRSLLAGGIAFSRDQFFWTFWIGVPSLDVRAVIIDNLNNKWIANGDNGLSKLDDVLWTNYTTFNSKIPSNRIYSIAIDQNGYKWISTYEGGISKYKGN